MKMIDKDRVLRLNCPGFGEETHLNLGRAKSLDNYQVIIANPVSLLHLFDKGPEPNRRIHQLMSEGSSQLNVPDDSLIQELINESDARLEELIPFLSQGGLLIYFLCRPFVLAGPTISVDNYDWLSVYAPAVKNPPENGSRQMSALSQGRIIEPTEEGEQSELAEYLKQQGLEWNTIIRTDFLSSNYSVMATAGARKCVAAQFWAGDNGGKVVFLPAPYSPDFDRVLMGCVDKWYQEALRQGTIQESTAVPAGAAKEDPAFHKPAGPDFYNGEQLETPANLNPSGAPPPNPVVYAPPPLSSLLKFPGDAPPEPEAPKAQPPKGALKSLLSSNVLDDDDEFTTDLPPLPEVHTANAAAAAESAPQAVKLTAEDILASVSQEASRNTPSSGLAQAIAQARMNNDAVDAERPKMVEPETAQVSNFELKKATAEMDLSQFAQTARQLVEQANVIESATRDPAKDAAPPAAAPPSVPIPASAAKQRIADLLKGLEFGKGNDDSDDLEASPAPAAARTGEDLVDVDVTKSPASEKSSSLANDLKPNRESVSRNWLGTGNHAAQEATPSPGQLPAIDVTPAAKSQPAAGPAALPNISSMSNDEFRSTFEFLNADEPGLSEGSLTQGLLQGADIPDDKKSILAQTGLSADSLMNELSVMNELNALMEESAAQAARTNAKEVAPVQSLFKEEAKEESKGDDSAASREAERLEAELEDSERERSLQSLMASLAEPAAKAAPEPEPEPEPASAKETAKEPAAAAPAPAPVSPAVPAPILQTPDISFTDLIQVSARFDETKTAESVPSLKLDHEELTPPQTDVKPVVSMPAFPNMPAEAAALLAALSAPAPKEELPAAIPATAAPPSADWAWAPKEPASPQAPISPKTSSSRLQAAHTSLPASPPGTNLESAPASALPAPAPVPAPAPSPDQAAPAVSPASVNTAWASASEPATAPPPSPNLAWMPAATATPAPASPQAAAQSPGQNPAESPANTPPTPASLPTAAEISSAWAPLPTPVAPPAAPAVPAATVPPSPAVSPANVQAASASAWASTPAAAPAYEHPAHPTPHPPVPPVVAPPPVEAPSPSSAVAPPLPPAQSISPPAPPPTPAPAAVPPPAPVAGPTPQPSPSLAELNLSALAPPTPLPEPTLAAQQMAAQLTVPATTNGDGDKSALHSVSIREPAPSSETSSPASTKPQPEELIRKMQQLTTTSAPSWCTDYSFPFIEQLRKEHAQLAEQVRQLQNAMNGMEARLETVETLKIALLTGEQEAFLSASQEILTRVGWQVQASRNDPNELWLVNGERVEAIARVVRNQSGTNRSDLAQLAQSVIAFWDKYETEPKGLLLAQNFAHQHPGERTEPDFSPPLVDAAAKKSLCLMSSFQLLAMFKEGEMGQMTADEMRKRILDTNGKLAGFALDSTVAQPATV
jgi:hypothetical protein